MCYYVYIWDTFMSSWYKISTAYIEKEAAQDRITALSRTGEKYGIHAHKQAGWWLDAAPVALLEINNGEIT